MAESQIEIAEQEVQVKPKGTESREGVPGLIKNESRQKISLGEFYFEEIDGEKKSRLVRKEGDGVQVRLIRFNYEGKPEIFYSREQISDSQLRREYVALKIYKELGLNVPDVEVKTVDGKTALIVEDIGITKNIDLSRTPPSGEQRSQILKYYITSRLLNNPDFVYSLSGKDEGQLMLTNALPHTEKHEPAIFFSPANPLLKNYPDSKRYEKAFGLEINPNRETEQVMRQKIENFDNQRIAEIVLESGLPVEETRPLLEKLLAAKETTLEILTPLNLEESLNNTPEWDRLDERLEESEGNKPFKNLAERAKRITGIINEVRGNIKLISGEWEKKVGQTTADINLSPKELGAKLIGIRFADTETELVEGSREFLQIKGFLESKKRTFPELVYKLRGYSKIERALIDQTRTLQGKLERYADGSVEQMWEWLGNVLRRESTIHDLVNFLSPTKGQLEAMVELGHVVDEESIKSFVSKQNHDLFAGTLLPMLKQRRLEFKRTSENKTKALVSHLSIPSLVKTTLQEGALQSSYKQMQEGKTPAVNSPGGQQEILPQLAFAIDGAALGYGGLDKQAMQLETKYGKIVSFSSPLGAVGIESSVGFVAPYSSIVRGRKFVEHPCSGLGIREELHIFDPQHNNENKRGLEINTDELFLFVPEKDRSEWEGFLSKSKDQKGAGKNREWIESHLRSYPKYVDIDIYLRYLVDRESLGISRKPILGTFATNKEELIIHAGNVEQKTFTWVS